MEGHRGYSRGVRRLALLLAMLSLTACASASSNGHESVTTGQASSTTSPHLVPNRCPEDVMSSTFPPDQMVPISTQPGAVIGFHLGQFPEGPEADYGDPTVGKPTPQSTAAFERAKAMVPRQVPTPLPQPCCGGGETLQVRFANGEAALYGPCTMPESMDAIRQVLHDEYFSG